MRANELRIAIFSGNYNYVRDGANQALNQLVDYLLRRDVSVRIYSPTVESPAFEAKGDVVGIPAFPIPGRPEYRFPTHIPARVKDDLKRFAPNIVHIASPDVLGHRAITWGLRNRVARVASVHTRFETYFDYYHVGFLRPAAEWALKRLYGRCNAVVAPSQSMVDVLEQEGIARSVGIWTRGIDMDRFRPTRRSQDWRRSLGIGDDEVAIGFTGRLVMEKGLDIFSAAIARLEALGVPHRPLVVGEGPAGDWFRANMPNGVFAGYQTGDELGRAVASMDVFFNPSITETFGNVTLEAMACALPVVAANATGSSSLVEDGVTGRLVEPGNAAAFADALAAYCSDPALRKAHGDAGFNASKAYSWDAVNQTMIDTYLSVAGRG